MPVSSTARGGTTAMRTQKDMSKKLKDIVEVMYGHVSMLIVMQDYPDPDAIASAAGLRDLANAMAGVQCFVAHGGTLGRAENRAIVKYLDLKLHDVTQIDADRFDLVAMVDTQPGTGNNSLPEGIVPHIVIDHHPMRHATRSVAFTDIRSKYGATSTIILEYLREANIKIEAPVATALVYGIRSDTNDLGREAMQADIDALLSLYPLANKRALSRIETERVPRAYFQMLVEGLRNAETFGKCVVTGLGQIDNADMIGEVADLLLRNEGTEWTICYGFCDGKMLFSIRTSDVTANAGRIARRVVGRRGTGGGHDSLAGGQIPMEKDTESLRRRLESVILQRFLRAVGVNEDSGRRLVQS
jgi:nanoRNase/pAp phosphatase (c-di-AMP/oligoRNAs hydrolase)